MADRKSDKPKKRRGRPPKPTEEVRDHRTPFEVYVTEAERTRIIKNAEQVGMPVSVLLRNLGLCAQPKPIADQQTIAAIIHLEGRMALLTTQLQRVQAPPSDATMAELHRLCVTVRARLEAL